MSAIFGFVHLDGKAVDPEEIAHMGDALAMYGVDGGGQWQQGAIGLGQRLLQVTPQDAFEQQPLLGADGRHCLVMDGRIDNRPELIDLLRLEMPADHLPDSALISHAYARWGKACVQQLVGTFTFALWDATTHQLLVARSPIASPSLFFHATAQTLAFATMPKGLFALPHIARVMDESYLASSLIRMSSEPTATYYRNITRLLPGQMLMVDGARWSVEEFWQPDLARTIHFARDEEYVEAFNALFARVVQDHLRSPTPAGVMMSGGFDSTAVAAVVAQHYQQTGARLATFTEVPPANFDGATIRGRYADETPYVQAMAQQYPNLDLNLIQGDAAPAVMDSAARYTVDSLYLDDIDTLFAAAETPFPNASNRPWYEAIMAAAQAQGVRVLLTGAGGNLTISWGGDGLLAQLVGDGQWRQAWQTTQALARGGHVRAPLSHLYMRGILPHLPEWYYFATERLRGWKRKGSDSWVEVHDLSPIHPDFAAAHHADDLIRESDLRRRPTPETRTTRIHNLISGIRRGDGLNAGYQARYGVTVTDPTSDVRLVEFCLALPEAQYQRDGVTRWLLRRAMAQQLPTEVINNRQRGLQAADWYVRLCRGRGRILDALTRIEQCDLAQRALDLPRLRRMVESMDAQASPTRQHMVDYRNTLEQGLMMGSFMRWVEGGS